MHQLTILILISLLAVVTARECWWTNGCQPKTWKERGCFPTNEWETVRSESCGDAGDKYYCCRKEGGGSGGSKENPSPDSGYVERGDCSYYGEPGEIPPGFVLPSGDVFDPNARTAAHKTLPFGTRVRVKNLRNGKEITVKINDRGPFYPGRILDLTKNSFEQVEDTSKGTFPCEISTV
ncbi:lipoprotein-like protein [Dinothrombium tinctorium]|uniref:Lipoprotein-like protein n=1 Tax=Dinothrombium tinctorium TaxID=1965070 RepID=A0A3S4QTI1_9ACAR|nr:lipoprotein-like protein [Dinothrombium tinctorium]RWS07611.1 lipoprotein-like protein [Dinothrombium tinctorium]